MRVNQFVIDNLFGTEHFECKPGTLTLIRGENGAGKSSILRALAIVFEGGHDPSWLRKGAKNGVVALGLDTGQIISATVTATSTKREVLTADGQVVPAPMTFIRELGDSWAIDPARLLAIDASTKPGRRRLVEVLLELLPLAFSPEDILAHLPPEAQVRDAACTYFAAGSTLNLEGLEKARTSIEETRRRIGQQARDAQGTVESLRQGIGALTDDSNWPEVVSSTQAELRRHEASEQAKLLQLERECGDKLATQLAVLADEELAAREALSVALRGIGLRRQSIKEESARQLAADLLAIQEAGAPERDRLVALVATASERAETQVRADTLRGQVKVFERKQRSLSGEYDDLTALLRAVEEAKRLKLTALPVDGVEFDGETFLIDGVQWQNVNRARQVSAAIEICASRSGKLPFLLVDDAEHMDSGTFAAFEKAVLGSGFQAVAAQVSECDGLSIQTVE